MASITEKIIGTGGDDFFDSRLEKTDGKNSKQNAWLTVELKVALNFVDSTNPLPGKTVQTGPNWFMKDFDNWEFPIRDWTAGDKAAFANGFQSVAESTWNYKFLLTTPDTFDGLDILDSQGRSLIRPNVICLFRLRLVGPGFSFPASQTISGNVVPHKKIHVVKLKSSIATVSKAGGATKAVGTLNGPSFRSDDQHYDNLDLEAPVRNTIGHETGHSLGEGHIKCLGDHPLPICSTPEGGSSDTTYGTLDTPDEQRNLMGAGNAMTPVNSQPWKRRIQRHTNNIGFTPTMAIATLPRTLSIGTWMTGVRKF